MATELGLVVERLKDMTIEDLHDFSNIFSSEFNCSDMHDRVLCFEIIEDEEMIVKNDFGGDSKNDSESGSNIYVDVDKDLSDIVEVAVTAEVAAYAKDPVEEKFIPETEGKGGEKEDEVEAKDKVEKKAKAEKEDKALTDGEEDKQKTEDQVKTECEAETKETPSHEVSDLKEVVWDSRKVFGDEQKLDCQKIERECGEKGSDSNASEAADNKNKSIVSKLFVHSQWLAVQSSYFKALFYSGMRESYSKEVIMKIYEHELEAHQTFIEAMYKLDVLQVKDYRLVVQVLLLSHKYDARHVFKKCKYVLLSTTLSLEMCEHILGKTEDLSDTDDIYDMLEKFLVKEFTPIDDTWTLKKFASLSKAALRLLLRSDNLGTRSENTIFVALMKWVRTNVSWVALKECDLLHLVRFEFMSVDFLHDVVQDHHKARQMPGFNKYLVKGLAYYRFSKIRREQFEAKPKKRLVAEDADPTFSWVIDEEVEKKLTQFPGDRVTSSKFWYKGYEMQLNLFYAEDLSKCSFFLKVLNITGNACVCVSYKAKSVLFASSWVQMEEKLYTANAVSWGKKGLIRNAYQTEKGYTIEVWVKIK